MNYESGFTRGLFPSITIVSLTPLTLPGLALLAARPMSSSSSRLATTSCTRRCCRLWRPEPWRSGALTSRQGNARGESRRQLVLRAVFRETGGRWERSCRKAPGRRLLRVWPQIARCRTRVASSAEGGLGGGGARLLAPSVLGGTLPVRPTLLRVGFTRTGTQAHARLANGGYARKQEGKDSTLHARLCVWSRLRLWMLLPGAGSANVLPPAAGISCRRTLRDCLLAASHTVHLPNAFQRARAARAAQQPPPDSLCLCLRGAQGVHAPRANSSGMCWPDHSTIRPAPRVCVRTPCNAPRTPSPHRCLAAA